jgi:peptide/nickel transport system permease protein
MTAYLIRRFAFGVILVILASLISFTILKASPGDALAFEDPTLSAEYKEQLKRSFGLDQPAWKQYLGWSGLLRIGEVVGHGFQAPAGGWKTSTGLLQGNLGVSIAYKEDVWYVIQPRLLATLGLNVVALVVTWMVALPLGIYAAVNQYKWGDRVLSCVSFVGMSAPGFFIALLMLWIFSQKLGWLPPGGLRSLDFEKMGFWAKVADFAWHLLLPVTVIVIGALAGLQRITRGNMLEVLRQQYVQTARAKGLPEKKVIYKHALRNAVNPMVTILGFEFAALFSGAAILEIVINYPGMGKLMLESLQAKDQYLVMSVFLIGSCMLVLGSLLADVLLVLVDPRVSYD